MKIHFFCCLSPSSWWFVTVVTGSSSSPLRPRCFREEKAFPWLYLFTAEIIHYIRGLTCFIFSSVSSVLCVQVWSSFPAPGCEGNSCEVCFLFVCFKFFFIEALILPFTLQCEWKLILCMIWKNFISAPTWLFSHWTLMEVTMFPIAGMTLALAPTCLFQ